MKIRRVTALLPGSNCAACGADDCKAFARMVILDGTDAARCVICDAAMIGRIRDYVRQK
jgi:Na+-translocating ferredoxin:NAD+ oxidoreductase RNF subunit RnfB